MGWSQKDKWGVLWNINTDHAEGRQCLSYPLLFKLYSGRHCEDSFLSKPPPAVISSASGIRLVERHRN